MEGAWFEREEGGRLRCLLCPHGCRLAEGSYGLCGVRGNRAGAPHLAYRARSSSLADDPIEKKPLYRFLPGSRVFSVGFYGCGMRCPFCQNWEISQRREAEAPLLEAAELVALALRSGAPSLAFTYSEPTIHFEYLLEAAALARKAGLRTVLVTNGQLRPGPAAELLPLMDAVNLDIKCFSAEVYSRVLGGSLEATLEFARIAARSSWLEATTLVVPALDDWDRAVPAIAAFLATISPRIPLHLSAYHPAWKHEAPPTPPLLLARLRGLARASLESVYLGNLRGEAEEERCGSCGDLLLERRGHASRVRGLRARDGGGRPPLEEARAMCASCGHPEFFVIA